MLLRDVVRVRVLYDRSQKLSGVRAERALRESVERSQWVYGRGRKRAERTWRG